MDTVGLAAVPRRRDAASKPPTGVAGSAELRVGRLESLIVERPEATEPKRSPTDLGLVASPVAEGRLFRKVGKQFEPTGGSRHPMAILSPF